MEPEKGELATIANSPFFCLFYLQLSPEGLSAMDTFVLPHRK
jgi:hypothetical protein